MKYFTNEGQTGYTLISWTIKRSGFWLIIWISSTSVLLSCLQFDQFNSFICTNFTQLVLIFDVVVNVNLLLILFASIQLHLYIFYCIYCIYCTTVQYFSVFAVNAFKGGSFDAKNDRLRIRRVFLDYNFGLFNAKLPSYYEFFPS